MQTIGKADRRNKLFRPDMRLRICFLSRVSPFDQTSWSGITYHLFKQISKYHHVSWTGLVKMSPVKRRILWAREILNRMLHRKFTSHYYLNAKFLAATIKPVIREKDYDCIVVGAGETELIACLDTRLPIIFIADSTFANMVNYYPWHTNLCKSAIRQGNSIEKSAIQKSAHIMYSSEWAANSAIHYYGANKNKVSVVDFGANLINIPPKEVILSKPRSNKCRLLFLGVQWQRKGGDIAYETFLELRKSGCSCTLTIIGCDPPLQKDIDLTVIPFLDKNNEKDFSTLYRILLETDILLIPTRADCTPIVFSEAAAFGIPVITTETGGISSVIREGKNGYYLSLDAIPMDYCRLIMKIWNDKALVQSLIQSSRNEYETRLNWDCWVNRFNTLVVNTISA